MIRKAFLDAGVVLIVLPNLKSSGINGATKKIGRKVLLMVNDRRHYADTFWFTLFHEIGHILNGDLGISYDGIEDEADLYAQNVLIPQEEYDRFTQEHRVFDEKTIRGFAESINQDPGIILGRLQMDKKVSYRDTYLSDRLRHKYSYHV